MIKKYWYIGAVIILLLSFLPNSTNTLAGLMIRDYKPSTLVQEADIICTATVLSTQCQWKDDHRGKHIYTHVELFIERRIKGDLSTNHIDMEVVGGTVGDITESVSHSPVFTTSEKTLLFLEGQPLRLVGGVMGKMPVFDDEIFWGGRKIPLEAFSTSVALGIEEVYDEFDGGLRKNDAGTLLEITRIVPDIGSAGTDTPITIQGTGFGEYDRHGQVTFFYRDREPRMNASIISWSDTKIVCTVPIDSINGYSGSAGSGPVTVTTLIGTSNEYPFRVTFGFDGQYWWGESPVVPYYVNENTSDCTGEGAEVQAAAETWNNTSASFRFRYAGSHKNTESTRNGKNEIMWGTPDTRALAVTHIWRKQTFYDRDRSPGRYEIIECDMLFNDPGENWSTNPSESEADVQSIALHEFGHFLSLRDLYGDIEDNEYDFAKVMYGYSDGSTLKRNLHPDDVAGIHWIYPPADPPEIPESIDYPSEDDGIYTVTWTTCSAASSYQLERSIDGADWVQIYSGPHTFFDETVDDGNYRYRVTASNTAGSSDWRTGDWNCFVQFLIWQGSGEPNDPFLISTAQQLDRVGTNSIWWNRHFKLTADIDLSDYDGLDGRPTFHTIATNGESERWTGVFDGNDHTISNLTHISGTSGHAGLFGCIDDPDAQVKRLGLVGSYVEHTNAKVEDRTGTLAGLLKEGAIIGCYIDKASVRGAKRVGGLVGENVNGEIVDCYANVGVYGTDDVGGLVGYNSGQVSASFSKGTITGSGWGIGGVAGTNNPQAIISHCYSSSRISGRERVGGLVGENRKGTVTQCYSTGEILGNNEFTGGLVGDNVNGNIEACFWDIYTSNQSTSAGGAGKSTREMHQADTYLEAGWDFVDESENGSEDIWWIEEGKDYPRLWWE